MSFKDLYVCRQTKYGKNGNLVRWTPLEPYWIFEAYLLKRLKFYQIWCFVFVAITAFTFGIACYYANKSRHCMTGYAIAQYMQEHTD